MARTARNSSAYGRKAEFIRSLPDLPAKEVVARARAAGIKLTTAQVYGTRSYARHSGTRGPGRPRGSIKGANADKMFKTLVIELGVRRARELLDEVERKLRTLVEG